MKTRLGFLGLLAFMATSPVHAQDFTQNMSTPNVGAHSVYADDSGNVSNGDVHSEDKSSTDAGTDSDAKDRRPSDIDLHIQQAMESAKLNPRQRDEVTEISKHVFATRTTLRHRRNFRNMLYRQHRMFVHEHNAPGLTATNASIAGVTTQISAIESDLLKMQGQEKRLLVGLSNANHLVEGINANLTVATTQMSNLLDGGGKAGKGIGGISTGVDDLNRKVDLILSHFPSTPAVTAPADTAPTPARKFPWSVVKWVLFIAVLGGLINFVRLKSWGWIGLVLIAGLIIAIILAVI